MNHIPVAVLALLTLAACQPRPPEREVAGSTAAPAAAPMSPAVSGNMDVSQPISVLGTEPFWSVTVEGTTLTLKKPDTADKTFVAPGAAIQPGRATWIAKAADGAQLTLTLYASECSDGMSDRKYPWSAEVVILDEGLRGCAVKTAEMPKGGGGAP